MMQRNRKKAENEQHISAFKRIVAVILAVSAALFPLAQMGALLLTATDERFADEFIDSKTFGTIIDAAIETHYDGDGWNFEPRLSDGVHITSNSGDLHLKGHPDGEYFVFEETKTLSFTAQFDSGWSYNSKYSYFFSEDCDAASTKTLADGSVRFTYRAQKGARAAVAELAAACINATADELPRLNIEIDAEFDSVTKDEWIDARFSLQIGTKEFASGNYNGTGKIKGRGNSSWSYPKKPYSIKLDKKASLLDIPKTKKYAVVASYSDLSLMRNYITYKAYQGLLGIDYVPKCEFVDVYLNGEYNGIYILVERISVEKSKVNIEEADAEHISGGYLIEKNVHGRVNYKKEQWFECPYQANQVKDYFVLAEPEAESTDLRGKMLRYLYEYMQKVHNSIMGLSDEPYTEYIDADSWVDFVIVQEVCKNIDGNLKTSCWMYKERDDNKLYMTAPWDFDLAYGLVDWSNADEENNDAADCPTSGTYEDFMIINSSCPWVKKLYEQTEFRALLTERYTYYRATVIAELQALIPEQAAYLSKAEKANNKLWNKNFSAGVEKLQTWLNGRLEWLDGVWLAENKEN